MLADFPISSRPYPVLAYVCDTCGFDLWSPVADVSTKSQLALYDDNRFPGRCLLVLREHYEHFDQLPPELATKFMSDVTQAVIAIRKTTGCARVNIAILGNSEPHVHAHLIPRYPSREEFPHDTPWKDPRPEAVLEERVKVTLIEGLRAALA